MGWCHWSDVKYMLVSCRNHNFYKKNTSSSSGWHSCFLFGESWVQIYAWRSAIMGCFSWFYSAPEGKYRYSTSHYSTISSFNALSSPLGTNSLSYSLTHSLTRGAERSRQLCSYSRTSQHFMEPEDSSPCSQEPSTGPILSHINQIHTIPL
jgi:hypothetical protein